MAGDKVGDLRFFDVMDAPPKRGRPKTLVNLDEVTRGIVEVYGLRNRKYMPWAGGGADFGQFRSKLEPVSRGRESGRPGRSGRSLRHRRRCWAISCCLWLGTTR